MAIHRSISRSSTPLIQRVAAIIRLALDCLLNGIEKYLSFKLKKMRVLTIT